MKCPPEACKASTPESWTDTAIFDRLSAEVGAREGELLQGADDRKYVVESGRLRQVVNPSAIGLTSIRHGRWIC